MNVDLTVAASPLRAVSPSTIIAGKLCALLEQAKNIPALDKHFLNDLQQTERLANGLDPYLEACSTAASADLSRLVAETQGTDWKERFHSGHTSIELESEMVSGHVEGQFLKMLVSLMKARHVLEIGLFTGYSALAMAEALPEDGKLVACEIDPFAASFASAQFAKSAHQHKISVMVGDAVGSVKQLNSSNTSFDLIFIDADKPGYQTYLDLVLSGSLLAPDGLICVDNTLMQGQPYLADACTPNGLAIAEFNRRLANDSRVEQVMLPLRDGLTLIRRLHRTGEQ